MSRSIRCRSATPASWRCPRAVLGLQLTAVQNIPGGVERPRREDFARQRAGASASYSLLRYGAAYSQRLADDWQLRLRFNGQVHTIGAHPGRAVRRRRRRFGARLPGARSGRRQGPASPVRKSRRPTGAPAAAAIVVQCRAAAFVDGAQRDPQQDAARAKSSACRSPASAWGCASSWSGAPACWSTTASVLNGGGVRARGDNRVHVALSLNY